MLALRNQLRSLNFRNASGGVSPWAPPRWMTIAVDMTGPPNRTDAPADSNVPSFRTFVDHEGARWRVFEQSFSDYDRRSGMSLIFASDGAVRRVRNYPPDWTTLSDEELILLSWNP